MKRRFVFAIPFMVLAFVLLGGLAVMLLWNAILPTVLGVSVLNIWQAIGILALSRLLFGGFGGGPWRGRRGGPPSLEKPMGEYDRRRKRKAQGRNDREKRGLEEQIPW